MNWAMSQDKEVRGTGNRKTPGAGLMAEGKSVRAVINAPVEAGRGDWCGGRAH